MTISSGQRIDQRVPIEVWKHICSYLYPSQLCRLSTVNHTFDAIVSSLPIWRYLYISFSPDKRLRLLFNKPASKSYMLYVCANSLHICEECYWYARATTLVHFPLPVLVPLPKFRPFQEEDEDVDKLKVTSSTSDLGVGGLRNRRPELMDRLHGIHGEGPIAYMTDDGNESFVNEGIQYVGTPLNSTWAVRKCLDCRKKQREERGPCEIIGITPTRSHQSMSTSAWRRIYPEYDRSRGSYGAIDEDAVIQTLKKHYGGVTDVEASKMSSRECYMKTKTRILWYRQQD